MYVYVCNTIKYYVEIQIQTTGNMLHVFIYRLKFYKPHGIFGLEVAPDAPSVPCLTFNTFLMID